MNNSSVEFKNGSTNNLLKDSNASKKTCVPESPSDQRGKKRDHSPEKDSNKKRALPQRIAENTSQEEGKLKEHSKLQPAQPCQQQTMPMHPASTSTYPTSGYATSDYYAVDPSQSNYMMPQYNMYNTMNQWGASVNSSMPSMDMASTSTGMNPYPYVFPADPSMYGMMAPMPGYCPMPMMNGALPAMPPKVTKTFPSGTLVPPPPGACAPTRKNRPNGCKTVFVGGLPEKITEEIIKEAFSDCGEIDTVRMSKKNFCHIRFTSEHHVDQAMFFSGYRIKIENKDEPRYSSRIHVDFAIARDDQHDYECLMRTLNREVRHANFQPPSSPPIVNYSTCEAATVGENLRNEETFKQAIDVLITWLGRGECNKRNAGTFYSMIQSAYSHVGRLVAKKTIIEYEVTAVKQRLHQQSTSNAASLNDIERVLTNAVTQKVWDHFTKAQRKRIDQWKKQTTDAIKENLDDLLEERVEDDIENQDAREDSEKSSEVREELSRLQEENELLCGQLQTANEATLSLKNESEKKIAELEDTCQLMQQDNLNTKKKLEEALKMNLASKNRSILLDRPQMCHGNCPSPCGGESTTESEARLISLIANFLNIHPLGASIDYICSYLVVMDRNINTRDVENLMKKFNTVFKEESTGIGATLEKKWTFWGYKHYSSDTSESYF